MTAKLTMVDPIDNIARQARQGSVSAIIQVLNELLANSGVRTRAIFENGVLQLLCEAATLEQLEQSILVPHVCQILETLQPRGIRRVKINSRIVREQQLLWLEEINRDPENQLLWSEEITLAQPNLMQRVFDDLRSSTSDLDRGALPKATSPRMLRERRQFWRGIMGGASLSLLLFLVGWAVYDWVELSDRPQPEATATNPAASITPDEPIPSEPTALVETTDSPNATGGADTATQANPTNNLAEAATAPLPVTPVSEVSSTPAPDPDPFVQAVRLAEQAVTDGKTAQTPADWLDLATRWQRASDLMGQVPTNDSRYATARDRTEVYRKNSAAALKQAEVRRSPTANQAGNTP